MTQRIIGVIGFIGSGKGTVGEYLVRHHGYKAVSFAGSLKDASSAIFGWPRELLEGDTTESREWREQIDPYWSKQMYRTVTPRWVLQQLGTEVFRNNFFDNIWVASLERKILQESNNIVITDVRFPNEINLVKKMNGGQLWWIKRGSVPNWYQCAAKCPDKMPTAWPSVHSSEYEWINCGPFSILENNGTLEQLYQQVDCLL